MNLKRQALILVVQSYQRRKEVPYMEVTRDNDQKKKEVPYMEVPRDTDAYKSSNFLFFKSLFNFQSQKSTRFFQLPAFYLVHPWPTTLQKPWTNWLAPTMWTLARVKTYLDAFLGPKMTPTIWILN